MPDVVDDHVGSATAFTIDDDSDVRHTASKVISDKVAGLVVPWAACSQQRLPPALKEDHQIRNAAVVDVGVRLRQNPSPLPRIGGEILLHVFVHFFLQIDSDCSIRTDDLVGTNSGVGGNVAARILNANVCGVIAN